MLSSCWVGFLCLRPRLPLTHSQPPHAPGLQTIDSLFVLWRPDFKQYSVYIGKTVDKSTSSKPLGTDPQNVLTAGLTLQQYGLVSTLLRLYNAPGGIKTTVSGANQTCGGCLEQLLASNATLADVPSTS